MGFGSWHFAKLALRIVRWKLECSMSCFDTRLFQGVNNPTTFLHSPFTIRIASAKSLSLLTTIAQSNIFLCASFTRCTARLTSDPFSSVSIAVHISSILGKAKGLWKKLLPKTLRLVGENDEGGKKIIAELCGRLSGLGPFCDVATASE